MPFPTEHEKFYNIRDHIVKQSELQHYRNETKRIRELYEMKRKFTVKVGYRTEPREVDLVFNGVGVTHIPVEG